MDNLLEVKALKKLFPVNKILRKPRDFVYAVNGVSLSVKQGDIFGVVGESGCGKTTLARCISRLIKPTAGEIYFDGNNLTKLTNKKMRTIRQNMQIVFQDPMSSLDPMQTIKGIVGEGLKIHKLAKGSEIRERVVETLERVGLKDAHIYLDRYPHEFSGGQRQRIGIARALILKPKFLILDEPTSSLDVSVQSGVLNLLLELQKEKNLTYFFISHNLNVIAHMCNRIAVMYLGKVVETGTRDELFRKPRHPYTYSLFSAIPVADPDRVNKKVILKGDVPSPRNPPPGCNFHTRCPFAEPICKEKDPDMEEAEHEHVLSCHFWRNLDLQMD